ncbi:MAG: hypothetical protein JXR07_18985 [Reichenbachiella sp.]
MKNSILVAVITILFLSCSKETIDPESSFFKIYDTEQSDASFRPIDIVQTTQGLIVLAEQEIDNSNFMGAQVLQMDSQGDFLIESSIPGDHITPVGEFVSIDSVYYFFTMNPNTFAAQLVRMGNDPSAGETISLSNGLQYPLAANRTVNGNLMLLSYNAQSMQTVLSILDIDGNLIQSTGYTIGAGNDVEDIIIRHFEDPERYALPFFCGTIGIDSYYFNGFYNFSLSLVFTDLSATPSGVVQGQSDNGGISHAMPLSTNTFTLFGFQYNDNFIQPVQEINTNEINSSIDYLTLPFSEFISRTPAVIRAYSLNGTIYSIVAAESQSRSVLLYFYNVNTGLLEGIYTIGHLNPYTLGSIKVDAENNLIVLGTTLVSSRLSRIFVNKLSENEIAAILN